MNDNDTQVVAESYPPDPIPNVTYADHSYPAYNMRAMRAYADATAALRVRGAEDAADHNFNLIQYFDHWLLEQGHYNVEHTEEEHGAMAPAMNWIASVQAMIAARGAVPSDYLRIAELVRHARDNRGSKDWPLMHMDLSEAAEIADKLAAAPQPPAALPGEQDGGAA